MKDVSIQLVDTGGLSDCSCCIQCSSYAKKRPHQEFRDDGDGVQYI